jgi:hypothetical protein
MFFGLSVLLFFFFRTFVQIVEIFSYQNVLYGLKQIKQSESPNLRRNAETEKKLQVVGSFRAEFRTRNL